MKYIYIHRTRSHARIGKRVSRVVIYIFRVFFCAFSIARFFFMSARNITYICILYSILYVICGRVLWVSRAHMCVVMARADCYRASHAVTNEHYTSAWAAIAGVRKLIDYKYMYKCTRPRDWRRPCYMCSIYMYEVHTYRSKFISHYTKLGANNKYIWSPTFRTNVRSLSLAGLMRYIKYILLGIGIGQSHTISKTYIQVWTQVIWWYTSIDYSAVVVVRLYTKPHPHSNELKYRQIYVICMYTYKYNILCQAHTFRVYLGYIMAPGSHYDILMDTIDCEYSVPSIAFR